MSTRPPETSMSHGTFKYKQQISPDARSSDAGFHISIQVSQRKPAGRQHENSSSQSEMLISEWNLLSSGDVKHRKSRAHCAESHDSAIHTPTRVGRRKTFTTPAHRQTDVDMDWKNATPSSVIMANADVVTSPPSLVSTPHTVTATSTRSSLVGDDVNAACAAQPSPESCKLATLHASLEDLPNRRSSAIPGSLRPLSEIQNFSPAQSIRKHKLRDSLKLVSPPSSTKSLILGSPRSVMHDDSYLFDSTEALHANSTEQQSPMSDLQNLPPQELETTMNARRKSITLVSPPTSHNIRLPLFTMETLGEEREVRVALKQHKEDCDPLVHNDGDGREASEARRRDSIKALKLEKSESVRHDQCANIAEEFDSIRCWGTLERTRGMIAPKPLEQRNEVIPEAAMDDGVYRDIDDDLTHAAKCHSSTQGSPSCVGAQQVAVNKQVSEKKIDDSSARADILRRVEQRPRAGHDKQKRRREQSLPPRLEGAVRKSNISASSRVDTLVAEFRDTEPISRCTHNANDDDNVIFIPLNEHELSSTYANLRAQACEQLQTIKDDVEGFVEQFKATTIDHVNDLVSTPQSRCASIKCISHSNDDQDSNEYNKSCFLSTQAMCDRLCRLTPNIAQSLEQEFTTSPSLDLSVRRSVREFVNYWESGANGVLLPPPRDRVVVDNTSIGSPELSRPFAPIPMAYFRMSLQSDDVTRSPPIAASPVHIARFLEENNEHDTHRSSQFLDGSLSPNVAPVTVTSIGAPDDVLHKEQSNSSLLSQESLQQMRHSASMPQMTLSSEIYTLDDARVALSDVASDRGRHLSKDQGSTPAAARTIDATLPNTDSPRLTLTDEMPVRSGIVARLFHSPSPSPRHAHERNAACAPKRLHGLGSPSIEPSLPDLFLTESSALLNDSTVQSANIAHKQFETAALSDRDLSSREGDCPMHGVDNDHLPATNVPRSDDESCVRLSEERTPYNEVSQGDSNLQGDENEHMTKSPRFDSTFSICASKEGLPDDAASAFLHECPAQLDKHFDEGSSNVSSACNDVCNSDAANWMPTFSTMTAEKNALQNTTTRETMIAPEECAQEAQELGNMTSQHEAPVHSAHSESAKSLNVRNAGEENAAQKQVAASKKIRGHADDTVDCGISVDMTAQQLPENVTSHGMDHSGRAKSGINEPSTNIVENCPPQAVRRSRVRPATPQSSTKQNLELRAELQGIVALGDSNMQSSISVKAKIKKIRLQAAPKVVTRRPRTASMPRTSVRSTQSTVSSSSAETQHLTRPRSAFRGSIKSNSNSNFVATRQRSAGTRVATKPVSSASSATASDGQSMRRPSSVSHASTKSNLSSVDGQAVRATSSGRASVKPRDPMPLSKNAARKTGMLPRGRYTKGSCKGFTDDMRASQQPSETTRATAQASHSSNASTKRTCDALSQAMHHDASYRAVSSSAKVKRHSRKSGEPLTMERLDKMLLPTRQAMSQIEALVARPGEKDACHASTSSNAVGGRDKMQTALSTFQNDSVSPTRLLLSDSATPHTTPAWQEKLNISPNALLHDDDETYSDSLIHPDLRSMLVSTRSHATQITEFTLQEPHRSSLVSKHESLTTSMTAQEPLFAPLLVPSHESDAKSLALPCKESHADPPSVENNERQTLPLKLKTRSEFVSPTSAGPRTTDVLSATHPCCSPRGLNNEVTGWRPVDTARNRRNDEIVRLEAEIMKRASSMPRSQTPTFRARVPPKSTYRKYEWPDVPKRELTSPTRAPHLYTSEPARVREYKHCCQPSTDSTVKRPFRASPVPASLYDQEHLRRPSPAPLTSPQTPKCFKRSSTPQASLRHRNDHRAREQ